jgi:hypothetical protein
MENNNKTSLDHIVIAVPDLNELIKYVSNELGIAPKFSGKNI